MHGQQNIKISDYLVSVIEGLNFKQYLCIT